MPKMCALVAPGAKGDPVYVNPSTVRYVRPGTTGTVVIYFGDDQSVSVAMPINQVIEALSAGRPTDLPAQDGPTAEKECGSLRR